MGKIEKSQSLSLKKADAAADIGLINRYSRRELTPEEVYCFSVVLCDNEVDRDWERFTEAALDKLAGLYIGKTGILDHQWTASGQVARLYRVEVEKTGEKNSLGEPLLRLRGSAYMLRADSTQPIIDAIEGGIMKEVSVGFAASGCVCSICGERMEYGGCKNGHRKGQEYDGQLCVGELRDPIDAYEFSFVAVPSQRGAGVTKGLKTPDEALDMLMTADLRGSAEKIRLLLPRLTDALEDDGERRKRAEIIAENAKFLKKERKIENGKTDVV